MTTTAKTSAITSLSKPITRRIRDRRLIVRLTKDGLSFRGHHKRKWRKVTWEQIASLSNEDEPVLMKPEQSGGRKTLAAMGAE